MCLLLREALSVFKLGFHSSFFSIELGAQAAKKRLADELLNYSVVTEAPKSAFGKVRKTFTGKLNGFLDDVAVVLQLALISAQRFFQEPRYATLRDPSLDVNAGTRF